MRELIKKAKWHCVYNPSRQCYDLYLLAYFYNQETPLYAKSIEFVEDKGFEELPPLVRLHDRGNVAQTLMDALWKSGLRPTEVGSAGQLSAVQAHLEDMRKIVFESF